MTYLTESLAHLRTGCLIEWQDGYYTVVRPYNPKSPWDEIAYRCADPTEALYIYKRWCAWLMPPPPLTPEYIQNHLHMFMAPLPGLDDTFERENRDTGLGESPKWWRPDARHYD